MYIDMKTVCFIYLNFSKTSKPIMRALTGGDTDRSALSSSLKENLTMCSENEGIMRVLKRHEMMLADIQK